jgi:lipopolysaccharide export system protein LptA
VELAASYTGESGIGLGSERPEGGVRQAAALKRVQARKAVLITSKDGESGSGERGDFDIKANTVTLIGNVVLMQGGNTATGPKAVIDLSTGKSQIVPDAITATGQDHGTEPAAPRASGTGASRPSLLFYPSQVKDKDKAKQKGSSGETKRENKDATGAAKERAGGDATRASSWSADTRSGFGAND